ncbi:MAG: hypothetical protein HFH71_00215 [Clostridia bacterium]|mgnify:FL=1|nr:hypothetical protein [Clostridia bacterium]
MSVVTFDTRVRQDERNSAFYDSVREALLGYAGVKSRCSIRCDSFRYRGKLIAKIAIGGRTLKLYLDAKVPDGIKASNVDKGGIDAYSEVPLLLPLKSGVAVRKAIAVIDSMMRDKGIVKA